MLQKLQFYMYFLLDLLFNKQSGKIFRAKKTAISATPGLLILSHILVIGSLYTLCTKKS